MRLHVLKAPYDSGHRCERMARGPGYILASRMLDRYAPVVETIETTLPFTPEVQTAFDLARQIAVRVRAIREEGGFPLLLSGNCNGALGMIAGLDPRETGVLWFDAHGEFNTPETTRSGFFDGMPLAIATGQCWRALADSIPGWSPILGGRVVLAGVRDCEPDEWTALRDSEVIQIAPEDLNRDPASALDRMARGVRRLYLHFDLDALDPSEATSNQWVPRGGLRLNALLEAIAAAAQRYPIGGVTLASLDPACDEDGRALAAARAILDTVLEIATR